MKVKIIPDTNIIMKYNEEFNTFFSKNPNFIIYISRIILNELDSQKSSLKSARMAIKFINNYHNTKYIQIEGHGCIEKMDIEIQNEQKIQIKQNDDKIIKFAYDHTDFVLVTADRVMALKAVSYGVKALIDEKNDFETLIDQIYTYFGYLKSYCSNDNNGNNKENNTRAYFKHNSDAFKIIVPDQSTEKHKTINDSIKVNRTINDSTKIKKNVYQYKIEDVESILINFVTEIAEKHELKIKNIKCMQDLLEFVLNNFVCFQIYLPNHCKSDLKKLKHEMKKENVMDERYKRNMRKLLVIFGCADCEFE
ncbi:hypothetical protein BDAP_001021 [Binucleata daphniae]